MKARILLWPQGRQDVNLSCDLIVSALRQFFANHGTDPCPIVAAVSGGLDSTALLLALAELRDDGFGVVAAHVNHHLRGAESDGDEQFVRELCARLHVPLRVAGGTLDEQLVRARGIEAAARDIRYQRLSSIREETGSRFVATAHQMDDQAETVLIRLLTGSGMAGLRGIHPLRGDGFIRPLLGVTRAEIESFLSERQVTPRLDRSNSDLRFLRNRVRLFVRETGAVRTLAAVADQARAHWPLLERLIDEAEKACAVVKEDETEFARATFAGTHEWLRGALLLRHIRRLDPAARDFDAQRIASTVGSTHRLTVTRTLELVRKGDSLILRRHPAASPRFDLDLTPGASVTLPSGKSIHLAVASAATGSRQRFQLPAGMRPEFRVRNRRAGDRFQPLGLAGSKKLKDLLIDRKIPAELRDQIPLLICNDEIVWVGGVEISERFKVATSSGVTYAVWMEDSGARDDDHSGLQR